MPCGNLPPMPGTGHFAAVDLGSSSFHVVVGRVENGHLHVMDRIRERVGLAAGLDAEGRLDAPSAERAIACLARFGERLAELPADSIRAVGTSTLRRAKNSAEFLEAAEQALGHRIELISGQEEARLIYLGVSRSVPQYPRRRIVVDIGGGSTELILGQGSRPIERDSVQMGHLRWAVKYFSDGRFTEEAFEEARTRARLELGALKRRYRTLGWEVAYGSSGTAKAVEEIAREAGWSEDGITQRALERLEEELLDAGTVAELQARALPGLSVDRATSIGGGVSILRAVFETLKIDKMVASQGALREGVLHDLVGRMHDEDARDVTITNFGDRYSIDRQHAARVEKTTLTLFHQVADPWGLNRLDGQRFLSWACQLHEVGLSLNHSGFHKHGAYLIRNADMPGFSRADQALLAAVVRCHRRKLLPERVALHLGPSQVETALRFSILLRIATRLHRTRSSKTLPPIEMTVAGDAGEEIRLRFPRGWLDEHPLKRADLLDEASLLPAVGYSLTLG